MTQEAASPEFYSACLQVILISWLVVAIETQVVKHTGMPIKIILGALGVASMVAVLLCIGALDESDRYGEVGASFISVTTWSIAFIAVLSLVISVFQPERND
jgi:hypothetical protein